jgi:hypothetical protein
MEHQVGFIFFCQFEGIQALISVQYLMMHTPTV